MTITKTNLTSGTNTTDATSFQTANITPTANRLVLLAVLSTIASTTPNTPTASGNGLTYVEIANITFHTIASPWSRLTIFRAMGASPTTGRITMDFGGQTQGSCNWSVAEFDGINTSGTHGSGAIVQSASNSADASAGPLTVTLAAFGHADNATYATFASGLNGSFTPNGSLTEIHDTAINSPAATLETCWYAGNDTSPDATPNTTGDLAGIAIEIKSATATSTGGKVTGGKLVNHGLLKGHLVGA